MIERLRSLSPSLRYLIYVAGVLLVLLVSVGVGATAAVVVNWQSGPAAPGSAETSKLEGSELETTAGASEGTAIEPSGDSENSDDTVEVSFVHRATDENSRGDYTYLSDPSMNGDPNAIVLVSPTADQEDIGPSSHNTPPTRLPTHSSEQSPKATRLLAKATSCSFRKMRVVKRILAHDSSREWLVDNPRSESEAHSSMCRAHE